MGKIFSDMGDGEESNRTKAMKCLFRKVFNCSDGRRIISEIRRRTRLSPKSDLDYAKQAGVQFVMDMIFDMAEVFGEEIYGQ
jgi:hypothetical protein